MRSVITAPKAPSREASLPPPTAPPSTRSPGGRRAISPSREQAAVDGVHGAGDIGGLVLEQESPHPGDLFGTAETVHRHLVDDAVENLLGDCTHHLGLDEA